MNQSIIFGPLGWHRNIWDRILGEERDVLYIEFPARLANTYEESKQKILREINSSIGSCHVITSSYGTRFFLSIINEINIRIDNIILIDGLKEFPNYSLLKQICDNRNYIFESKQQFFDEMLGKEEQNQQFLRNAVRSLLMEDTQKIQHFMDNDTMYRAMSFLARDSINELICENLKQISVPTTVFTSENIEFSNRNLNTIKIRPEDHLLMLTQPELIRNTIFSPFSMVYGSYNL